jgi:hypothetical protein
VKVLTLKKSSEEDNPVFKIQYKISPGGGFSRETSIIYLIVKNRLNMKT